MPTPRKPKPVHPSIYNAEKAIQRAHKAIHTNTLLYPPTFQSITLNNNNNNNNNILKLNQLSSIPLHVQHQPAIQTIKQYNFLHEYQAYIDSKRQKDNKNTTGMVKNSSGKRTRNVATP